MTHPVSVEKSGTWGRSRGIFHPKCYFFCAKVWFIWASDRLPPIFAGQHQVCRKLTCVLTFCMVDDSSCVMSAGLSLATFPPAVWANMFSRPRCGHCLMGSSQHGWYHHQVTLPGLDNTRLFPLRSYGKCPGEPCRMLHINTSWHLLGDKQPGINISFLWIHDGTASSQKAIFELSSLHQPYLKTNALSWVTSAS